MKKILLVIQGISGEVQLLYNLENQIEVIDFRMINLEPNQVAYITKHVPIIFNQETFLTILNSPKITYVIEEIKIDFEMWWGVFNKRGEAGANKKGCIPLFEALSYSETVHCYTGTIKYNNYLEAKANWRSKMNPERWLKKKEWNTKWE